MHITLLRKSHELTIFVDSSNFREKFAWSKGICAYQYNCNASVIPIESWAKMIIEFPQRFKKVLRFKAAFANWISRMKENLLRIRHKCNLYTYLFKSLVSDRFPYNKIGRRNMNKKRFCPNFQASTSTSKTLFYATLKLEPILKGGLPFPVLFVPLVSAETHCQQIKMQMGGRGKVEKSSICFLVVLCEWWR